MALLAEFASADSDIKMASAPYSTTIPVFDQGSWSFEIKSSLLQKMKNSEIEIIDTPKPVERNSSNKIVVYFDDQNSIDWDDKTIDGLLSLSLMTDEGKSVAFFVKPDSSEGHLVVIYDFKSSSDFGYCWFDAPFESQDTLIGTPAIRKDNDPEYDFDGECKLSRIK